MQLDNKQVWIIFAFEKYCDLEIQVTSVFRLPFVDPCLQCWNW